MRKLNRNREDLYTNSGNSEGYRQFVAVQAPRVRRRAREIYTYHLFISHRYARSEEYGRLVLMLDRAAERDSRRRWRNLSVPQEAPIMTQNEAKQGEVYEQRIRDRMRKVDVRRDLSFSHGERSASDVQPIHRADVFRQAAPAYARRSCPTLAIKSSIFCLKLRLV